MGAKLGGKFDLRGVGNPLGGELEHLGGILGPFGACMEHHRGGLGRLEIAWVASSMRFGVF